MIDKAIPWRASPDPSPIQDDTTRRFCFSVAQNLRWIRENWPTLPAPIKQTIIQQVNQPSDEEYRGQHSIQLVNGLFDLVGDKEKPGSNKAYSTDSSGKKGWWTVDSLKTAWKVTTKTDGVSPVTMTVGIGSWSYFEYGPFLWAGGDVTGTAPSFTIWAVLDDADAPTALSVIVSPTAPAGPAYARQLAVVTVDVTTNKVTNILQTECSFMYDLFPLENPLCLQVVGNKLGLLNWASHTATTFSATDEVLVNKTTTHQLEYLPASALRFDPHTFNGTAGVTGLPKTASAIGKLTTGGSGTAMGSMTITWADGLAITHSAPGSDVIQDVKGSPSSGGPGGTGTVTATVYRDPGWTLDHNELTYAVPGTSGLGGQNKNHDSRYAVQGDSYSGTAYFQSIGYEATPGITAAVTPKRIDLATGQLYTGGVGAEVNTLDWSVTRTLIAAARGKWSVTGSTETATSTATGSFTVSGGLGVAANAWSTGWYTHANTFLSASELSINGATKNYWNPTSGLLADIVGPVSLESTTDIHLTADTLIDLSADKIGGIINIHAADELYLTSKGTLHLDGAFISEKCAHPLTINTSYTTVAEGTALSIGTPAGGAITCYVRNGRLCTS